MSELQHGKFTSPSMTLDEMKILVKQEMQKRSIADDIIQQAVGALPHLKRWRGQMLNAQ